MFQSWLMILAMVAIPSLAFAGALEDGTEAFENQDYEPALKLLLPLAEQGNVEAQYEVGEIYARRPNRDYVEGRKWSLKAAEQGDALAQFRMATGYMPHLGSQEKDQVERFKWLRMAADQGYGYAQMRLTNFYSNGWGVPIDNAEAIKLTRQAADRGWEDAQAGLGLLYEAGNGVKQDYQEAYFWMRLAGHRRISGSIGEHLTREQLAAIDKRAAEWKPIPDPIADIAMRSDERLIYLRRYVGLPYIKRHPEILRPKAEIGNRYAQFRLGELYAGGLEGLRQDYVEAAKWYRRSADQGYWKAQANLGLLYRGGNGVKQDNQEAFFWTMVAGKFRGMDPWAPAGPPKAGYPINSYPSTVTLYGGLLTPEQMEAVKTRVKEWEPSIQHPP